MDDFMRPLLETVLQKNYCAASPATVTVIC